MTRQANGRSTIYQGSDGYWHGRVIVGVTDQGKPDRRHVMSRSKSVVAARVRELEKKREIGNVPLPGIRWTVAGWLEHWLENIARPTIRRSSYDAYRIAVRVHLIPGLGDHRLDRLRPEHLERLYRRMIANGARPATAHQVHRTIRTALGEAVRRRQVQENVATLAKAPKIETKELEPYSIAEVRRILTAARERRNAARWAIALSLGLRQGEVLGLRWSDIDLEAGILKITTNRVRPHYEHGCSTPCGKTPGHCTHRVQTNEDDGPTKSSAGKRKIGLPPQLLQLLEDHRYQQDQERTRAGRLLGGDGASFHRPVRPRGQAELRLSRLEGAIEAGGRARNTIARCPAYSCNRAFGPRGAGTHSHGRDGLVVDVDGRSLPARNRSHPT